MLKIENLYVSVSKQPILNGVNLEINPGSMNVLMGPNGSGKSTLAKTLLGHPAYNVDEGSIRIDEHDLTDAGPDVRSRAGLFLAFQYPVEVPGVNFANFLRLAYNARRPKEEQLPVFKFRHLLREKAAALAVNPELLERNLNEGLSGGEKKKAEILQMAVLEPKYVILDETDSGLDVDALKVVFNGVNALAKQYPAMAFLVITHYQRIFDFISPDTVHVMHAGVIKKSGGMELVDDINRNGYQNYQ